VKAWAPPLPLEGAAEITEGALSTQAWNVTPAVPAVAWKPGLRSMQWPAKKVTAALPLITTLFAASALLSEKSEVPELIVWFGIWVGFEHWAAKEAASG
jgi:hypothetical protein